MTQSFKNEQQCFQLNSENTKNKTAFTGENLWKTSATNILYIFFENLGEFSAKVSRIKDILMSETIFRK